MLRLKPLIFICFLLPIIAFAQTEDDLNLHPLKKLDSNITRISLPALGTTNFYKLFEVGHNSRYIYKITNDSLYYAIFSAQKDTIPVIDFTRKELFVSISCTQCGAAYKGYGWDNIPKHRNACRYVAFWFLEK
jgi:hypothetical protein